MTDTKAKAAPGSEGPEMDLNYELVHGPLNPIATDASGTDRIVGPPVERFTPAPVDATPAQIAHMEKMEERFKDTREKRKSALTGGELTDDTERALNNPGDSGSQAAVPPTDADKEVAGVTYPKK